MTERQIQILNCIARGNANKQIALKLEISEQTVKNHITRILEELGAYDRAHAVYLAIKKKIIKVEPEDD